MVKSNYIFISLAVTALMVSASAHADIDLKHFKEFVKDQAFTEQTHTYVTGVGRGIFWTNVQLGTLGQHQLFCMPDKLAPDQGLILSLLDQEITTPRSGTAYPDNTPVEAILLFAFESRFPCH